MSRPTKQKQCKQLVNRDLITRLPDTVLCHILSFLPTKESVATSILSRKWRYTWISTRNLELRDYYYKQSAKDADIFTKFVNRAFLLRHPTIKKFSLQVSNSHLSPGDISQWIWAAIVHKVEDLDLTCRDGTIVQLPEILSGCVTLKSLKLDGIFILKYPESLCLPNLKVLHLEVDDANVGKMLSCSPVLEELSIVWKSFDHLKTLHVQSATLKSLTIVNYKTTSNGIDNSHPYTLVIDAPKLEYLDLWDPVSEVFKVSSEMPLLVKAIVNVKYLDEKNINDYVDDQVFGLLRRISHIKSLTLSESTIEALFPPSSLDFPTFHNLNYLELTVRRNWLILPKILRITPKLQVFVLQNEDNKVGYDTPIFDEKSLPPLLMSSLERLEISNFEGTKINIEMVEYFLKHATVLKTMKITIFSDVFDAEKEAVILKELIKFPRASSACQILFSKEYIS